MEWIWGPYFVMVLMCIGLMVWMDKRAVMRGQQTGVTSGSRKEPIPEFVEQVLRFFFFWSLASPLCIMTSWWLAIPLMMYIPSYLDGSEKRGGRPSEYMRNSFIWFWFKRRMNMSLETTCKFDSSKQYIFGVHPHGIIPWGGILNLVTNISDAKTKLGVQDKLRFIAASFCFYIPVYRDLLLAGGMCDAARVYAEAHLRSGGSIGVVPGGATEALYAKPGVDVIYIRKRKGFAHLALQTGSALVPAYSFGETDAYDQLSDDLPFVTTIKQRFQRIFGLSLPLITNIIPRRCTVTTVVGKPIECEKDENPSKEKVDALLERYVEELQALYEAHQSRLRPGHKKNLVVL